MGGFKQGFGIGCGVVIAFLIFGVASCAIMMKASHEGLKEINQKLQTSTP
jgi:hypothetical protein